MLAVQQGGNENARDCCTMWFEKVEVPEELWINLELLETQAQKEELRRL